MQKVCQNNKGTVRFFTPFVAPGVETAIGATSGFFPFGGGG